MKKSQLVQIIKEELRGYSKYAPGGVTKGGTSDDFMQILTTIAKEPAPYELPDFSGDLERGRKAASVRRGNKILDKANPENVQRILNGEKPVYEGKGMTYAKEDLIWYLDRLDPNTEVTIPRIFPGGFSTHEGWRTTAEKAIDALSQTDLDGKFELWQDNPTSKKFSIVQSDEEKQRMEKLVRGTGRLD